MAIASEYRKVQLSRVHIPKASDILAEQMREVIILGAIPDGTELPTEKEMVEQAGLSRPTVREALRLLENEGLISIKPGRGGGAIVRHPSSDSLTKPLALLLRFQGTRLSDLLESRRLIEPLIARLAATHRRDKDLAILESALRMMGNDLTNIQAFLAANVNFHIGVASASGNAVLETVMSSLRDLILEFSSEVTIDIANRNLTLQEHTAIFEAVRAGDADMAAKCMLDHHVSFDNVMGNHYGDLSSILLTTRPWRLRLLNPDFGIKAAPPGRNVTAQDLVRGAAEAASHSHKGVS